MKAKTPDDGATDKHPIPIPQKRMGRTMKNAVMEKPAKTTKKKSSVWRNPTGERGEEYRARKMLEQRARSDSAYSIDAEYQEAVKNIDWERRNRARESLADFISTYLVGSLFSLQPEGKMCEALAAMEASLTSARPYNIELPRGSGKTTAAEAMCLYLLSYGIRKFLVVISNNQRAAGNILNDLYHVVSDGSSVFAQDFPEVCLPFVIANGSF